MSEVIITEDKRIRIARGLSTEWTSQNPILLDGEIGIETDTLKQKVGDSATSWNTLPYQIGTAIPEGALFTDTTYDVFTKTELSGTLGRMNNPLCRFSAKNGLNFEGAGSLSFKRDQATDGSVTIIDRYNALKYFNKDQPRFNKHGWINEPLSTNEVYPSEDVTYLVGNWTRTNAGIDSTVNTTTVFGNLILQEIDETNTGAKASMTQIFTIPDDSSSHTLSLFIKKGTSLVKSRIRILLYGGTTQVDSIGYADLTNDLNPIFTDVEVLEDDGEYGYRISITAQNNSSGNTTASIYLAPAYLVNSDVGSYYMGGIKFENLPSATSYTPTTIGAVTRNANLLQVDPYGNLPSITKQGTYLIEYTSNGVTALDGYILAVSGLSIQHRTNNTIRININGIAADIVADVEVGVTYKIAVTFENGTYWVRLNGILVATKTYTPYTTSIADVFVIGNLISPARPINGAVNNINFYDFIASSEEILLMHGA